MERTVSSTGPFPVSVVAVLRRILSGERGDPLLDGLDPIDAAIARETLTRLTPRSNDGP